MRSSAAAVCTAGFDEALSLFHSSALLELGMDCADGTGAALAWP